jgi:hypothetical protein
LGGAKGGFGPDRAEKSAKMSANPKNSCNRLKDSNSRMARGPFSGFFPQNPGPLKGEIVW